MDSEAFYVLLLEPMAQKYLSTPPTQLIAVWALRVGSSIMWLLPSTSGSHFGILATSLLLGIYVLAL